MLNNQSVTKFLSRRSLLTTLLLLALTLTACGDVGGSSSGAGGDKPATDTSLSYCKPELYSQAPISGRFWSDVGHVGKTDVLQGIGDPESNSVKGVSGAPVSLHLSNGKTVDTKTCPDGRFHFDANALEGSDVAVIDFHNSNCTTANCPSKLAELAGKREIKVVTFGDSIPSYPKKEHWFPEYLVEVAKPVAQIKNVNVAKPGTRTYNWLPSATDPDSDYFKKRIVPNKDADIFIFSLGGNNVLLDCYAKLITAVFPSQLDKILKDSRERVQKAFKEGREIIDGIREIAPNAEILWVSYMDYTKSFKTLKGLAMKWKRDKITKFLTEALQQQREMVSGYKGVLTLDMYGISQGNDIDGKPYNNDSYVIWDGIHLNQRGHYFYAAQVFRALGGVFLGEHVVGNKKPNQSTFRDFGVHRYVGYAPSSK